MFLPPIHATELHLAGACNVYLRWHTHRLRPLPALAALTLAQAQSFAAPAGLRILDLAADERHSLALVSLLPTDSASVCASKLKGRLSQWLRGRMGLAEAENLLGRGYFACTAGHNTGADVLGYLDKQPSHHGYDRRVMPPVFVEEREMSPEDEDRLNPTHAMAVLQFHVVLATEGRRGVFGSESGPAVAEEWRRLQEQEKFYLLKASFVPDHVHLAVRVHPAVAPAELVARLMNAAQARMARDFAEHLIGAGVGRLWTNSAYAGSYGDITTARMQGYVRRWEAQA